AQSLEGVARHASTHAAGVVVSDKPLVEYLPLHRPTRGDVDEALPVTQYPMEDVEAIGLLKIDFLGLATLTVMRRAAELIEKYQGVKLDMDSIPLDDPAIYELLSSGNVTGIFQVEGAGLRRVLQDMQPTRFEHIIAAISLYRPGPMEYIPTYIARMHGREKVEYRHPKLKPILEETYGIIVYQEEIIQIARDLAGYDAGDADLMRRAVGKKKKKDLLKHRGKFVKGAVERDIPKEVANQIFDDIEFFARYGFNKCLPGDVEVVDAGTGRLVRLEDIYHETAPIEQTIICDTGTLKMRTHHIAAVHNNGVKPVFRLTTALGRQIEATGNHPFYTFDGWRQLDELQVGDLIAVPRCLPAGGNTQWPDHEVIVLGHLLAEGNLCHPRSVYFYTQDEEQLDDYIKAVEQFDNVICSVSLHKGSYSVYAKRIQRDQEPGVVRWAKELGIWGKKANEKEIPAAAFELNSRQIALLLSRLWAGDGHLSDQGDGYTYCYYATASERLARQIQHLLLRLGVVSRLRTVNFPYRDGRIGYQVFVMGGEHIKNFAATVGAHFINERYRQLCAAALATNYDTARGTKDVVPVEVKELVREEKAAAGITWQQMRDEAGVAQGEFRPTSSALKRGFRRETIARLAEFFDSHGLSTYAESDVYWDEILSIEYVGEKQTYDLTVPDFHNFVANDILVHNSHAADYAMITCQTAYLKAKYPVEYMAALLSVERDDTDKIALIAADCHRMGIKLLPPDVNHSELGFTIEDLPDEIYQEDDVRRRRGIRFGLGAIKNVGEGPVEAILDARREGGPFESSDDFCRRVDLRKVQRRALECLIKVGALDRFGRRDQLLAVMDRMLGVSQEAHQAAEIGQLTMFGGETAAVLQSSILDSLPNPPETPRKIQLGWEKELTGLFLSEHPLHRMTDELDQHVTARCGEIDVSMAGQSVTLAGMVRSVRRITTRKGDPMAFAQIEDLQGSVEVTIFPRTWEQTREIWEEDNLIILQGKVDARNDRAQVLCNMAKLYEPEGEGEQRSGGAEERRSPSTTLRTSRGAEEQGSPSTTLRTSGGARVQGTAAAEGRSEQELAVEPDDAGFSAAQADDSPAGGSVLAD
ncbi:MAG: LAGLIDADG family homing endonuclease, partial [Anaerolineae bacterium]